jgi:hypothetical protein
VINVNCNRCGNPVDQNSSFCRTCGNQITNTVVPQTVGQPTVVPTVVPKKSNNATILTIVIVLVIFIGAGVAGVTLLKQTKANSQLLDGKTQNVAIDEDVTKNKTNEKTNKTGWKTTTTQRLDMVDNIQTYNLNGVILTVPDGYTSSIKNNILTVSYTNSKYYMVNVIDTVVKLINVEQYQKNLINEGYPGENFEFTTIGDLDTLKFEMNNEHGHIYTFLVQAEYNKTAIFMFFNENDVDFMKNTIIKNVEK